jgi:DNA-binding transcriptional regulator YiaG
MSGGQNFLPATSRCKKFPHDGSISELSFFQPPRGYKTVRAKTGGKSMPQPIHRLVAMAWHADRSAGNVVRHLNHDKTDNRPENLAWGTAADNSNDQVLAGRVLKGESHPNAILTLSQVETIRDAVKMGVTQRQLAEYFGVDFRTVSNVVTNRRWRTEQPADLSPNP